MSSTTRTHQCVNCCRSDVPLTLNPIDRLKSINFNCELKWILPTKLDCLPMCTLCSLTATSLSNSYNKFRNRTGVTSLISRIIPRTNQGNEFFQNGMNTSDCSDVSRKENEEEKILPFEREKQSTVDNIIVNVPNENQITNLLDYMEKRIKLVVPKLVSSDTKSLNCDPGQSCKYSCRICSRKFFTHSLKIRHDESAHANPKASFTCQLCNKIFFQKWFYYHHLKSMHDGIELKFTCTLCGEDFDSRQYLNSHNLASHKISINPFKCNHCEKSYASENDIVLLREHLVEFHKNSLEAKAAQNNMDQFAISRENAEFLCPTCQKRFKTGYERNVHILFDHYDHKMCLVCQESFSCNEEFLAHVKDSDHLIKSCHLCENRKFQNLNLFVRHLNAAHNPDQPYSFVCEMCGDAFKFCDQLTSHYKWHVRISVPRQFKCQKCAKSFMLKHHLTNHMKCIHNVQSSKDNPKRKVAKQISPSKGKLCVDNCMKCKYCNMTFNSRSGLSLHIRKSHITSAFTATQIPDKNANYMIAVFDESGRKYKCKICDKVFGRADHCKKHLSFLHQIKLSGAIGAGTYINRTYFKCVICNKVIHKHGHLRHMKVHEKRSNGQGTQNAQILMKCKFCKEELNGVLEMRNHFQKYHPDSTEAKAAVGNMRRQADDEKGINRHYDVINKCCICKYSFTSIVDKDKHDETFHKKEIKCLMCHMTFTKESECRQHEIKSHDDFSCRFCNQVLTSVENFHKHFESEHFQIPYICEFCEKHFPNYTNIQTHYHLHFPTLKKSDKIHKCDDCGHKFVSEKTLATHRLNKCGKGVPTLHRIRHKCRHCEQTFNRTYAYEMHVMKIHKIYAGYECDECGTLYYDVKGLNQHMLRFHDKFITYDITEIPKPKRYSIKDKKYKCGRCGELFVRVNDFNYHISKDHLRVNLKTGKPREQDATSTTKKYKKPKIPDSELTSSNSNSDFSEYSDDSDAG